MHLGSQGPAGGRHGSVLTTSCFLRLPSVLDIWVGAHLDTHTHTHTHPDSEAGWAFSVLNQAVDVGDLTQNCVWMSNTGIVCWL